MNTLIKYIAVLLLMASPLTALAQLGTLYNSRQHLSSSFVSQVFQDNNGLMWVATENGINTYDGYHFRTYSTEDGLTSGYTNCVIQSKEGTIYIGTNRGLYYLSKDKFQPVIDSNTGENQKEFISGLCIGPDDKVYVITSGRGIKYLSDIDKTSPLNGELDGTAACRSMTFDKNGVLWVATDNNGIFAIRNNRGKFSKIGHYIIEGKSGFNSLCVDNANNVYIGYVESGLYMFNRNKNSFELMPSTGNISVNSLALRGDGNIYVGTDGDGLKVMDTHNFSITSVSLRTYNLGLNKAKVQSIYEDKNGNLWLGLFQKGVFMMPPEMNGLGYIGYKQGAANTIGESCVMSILKQRNGNLWIATDRDGLYGNGKHFLSNNSSTSVPTTILTMAEDMQGKLWIGSFTDGFGWVDTNTGTYHRIPLSQTVAKRTFDLRTDSQGRIWVGSLGDGLICYDTKTENSIRYEASESGLPNAYILQMELSPDEKRLYIGTSVGLSCLDIPSRSWTKAFKKNLILEREYISAIKYDESIGLWVGSDCGLYYVNPKTVEIKKYTTADGLPSDNITSIEIDAKKNLWISTKNGLCCFNPKTGKADNFYSSDGLQSNEFCNGVSFTDNNGMMYFGGVEGVSFFNPETFTLQKRKHNVFLTSLQVGAERVREGNKSGIFTICDTPIDEATEFNFCHSDNTITLRFSTLTYSNTEHITYSYSIDGKKWIDLPTGQNELTLSSMTPGDYKLQVVAIDNGVKSDAKEILIVIHNAWYATPFARVIYFLIFISILIWGFYEQMRRNREKLSVQQYKHAEELNEQKLQSFINISHEIRTPMTLVISPLEQLMNEDNDPHRHSTYATIKRNAERILNLINQIMDIRKIDKGQMKMQMTQTNIVEFTREILEMFSHQSKSKHISLIFNSIDDNIPLWIDRSQFDKIIVNLMSNAMKYTGNGGEIRVGITTENKEGKDCAVITFFDNGEKISDESIHHIFDRFYQASSLANQNKVGTGVGLDLTRSLVHLHHGEISVENVSDGVIFTVTIPLGKDHLNDEEIADKQESSAAEKDGTSGTTLKSEPETKPLPHRTNRSTIFIVEDDDEIRTYLNAELSTLYNIRTFTNGAEALPAILQDIPDLIVSDVMMPQMNGNILCSKVRANINTNHIPFILLTGKGSDEDKLEGLETGADAYITKPFNMEILNRTITNLLNTRKLMKNKYTGKEDGNEMIDDIQLESNDDRLLNRIMNVINANINNSDLNIDMICTEVGISRVHLHRRMKELTNQTPHELIRNIRLKQAARLLRQKGQNVTEVMYHCGFNNATSFSTMFKKMYGLSPRDYMKQHE